MVDGGGRASPGYWWFVVIFALGRPFLSSTNALSQVTAAEQTSSADRAKAVALVAAGYGVGAGLTAIIHSLAPRCSASGASSPWPWCLCAWCP